MVVFWWFFWWPRRVEFVDKSCAYDAPPPIGAFMPLEFCCLDRCCRGRQPARCDRLKAAGDEFTIAALSLYVDTHAPRPLMPPGDPARAELVARLRLQQEPRDFLGHQNHRVVAGLQLVEAPGLVVAQRCGKVVEGSGGG